MSENWSSGGVAFRAQFAGTCLGCLKDTNNVQKCTELDRRSSKKYLFGKMCLMEKRNRPRNGQQVDVRMVWWDHSAYFFEAFWPGYVSGARTTIKNKREWPQTSPKTCENWERHCKKLTNNFFSKEFLKIRLEEARPLYIHIIKTKDWCF